MDKRSTLITGQTFLKLLQQLQEEKTKASMLLDCNGLIRAEGIINYIILNDAQPHLELRSGLKIDLSTIVAVNGTFSPGYSEC